MLHGWLLPVGCPAASQVIYESLHSSILLFPFTSEHMVIHLRISHSSLCRLNTTMASSNRPSFQPIYCTASAYGIPDFGATHPFIEQIKEAAESRHLNQPGILPRQVALVTKGAKHKGWLRHTLYQAYKASTGNELRWALHWALRIDNVYFELHRIEHTNDITFTASVWEEGRIQQITEEIEKFSTTYMTNQEIVAIGKSVPSLRNLMTDIAPKRTALY